MVVDVAGVRLELLHDTTTALLGNKVRAATLIFLNTRINVAELKGIVHEILSKHALAIRNT
jgi:hypothetical protein